MTQVGLPITLDSRALIGSGYRVPGDTGDDRAARTSEVSSGVHVFVPTDTPILQKVARREDGATESMIDQFGNLVWSIVRKFTFNDSEAEDAAQEIFIELWRHAPRFNPQVASESTFVAMIARRRMIDRIRRQKARVGTSPGSSHHEPVDERAASDLHAGEGVDDTLHAFRQLRPEHQQVLKLSIHHGQTHEQIAETTGLPLGTVKTHARRGLMQLRDLLTSTMRTKSASAAGGTS